MADLEEIRIYPFEVMSGVEDSLFFHLFAMIVAYESKNWDLTYGTLWAHSRHSSPSLSSESRS